MKIQYIVAVFAALYVIGRLALRYPDSALSRVLLSPFGPASDFATHAKAERRRSARLYFVLGLVFVAVWLSLSILTFRFASLSFETPWVMGSMFGSFLIGVTCLGAAALFRFLPASTDGGDSGST